jgi:poly(3-hydroxybutyrate) depolymerase
MQKRSHLPFVTSTHEADPRFSYALYTPQPRAGRPLRLLAAVHDSERDHLGFLHGFAPLADSHGLVVLAPLFPTNVLGDGNGDGYKVLHEPGIRYDLLLLGMIQEAARATGCDGERVLLHGYSGGAQFAHRFALLHPERVLAAAIAAPGEVTLADDHVDWWAGVRDTAQLFGRDVAWPAVALVPWHLAVGDQDVDTSQLSEQPPSRWWPDDETRRRAHRIDRLQALHRCLAHSGVAASFELMPGVEHHNGHEPAMACASRFFEQVLDRLPEPAPAPEPSPASGVSPGQSRSLSPAA